MVTTLMVVMICGFLVIVSLFVIRYSAEKQTLPDVITLPDGTRAEAFTVGPGWYGVVVQNGSRILIFDRDSGTLRQEVEIKPRP